MKIDKKSYNPIKGFRVAYGFKQKEIAELLGVAQNTYSQKENGAVNFSISEIKVLAELFNKPIEELLE